MTRDIAMTELMDAEARGDIETAEYWQAWIDAFDAGEIVEDAEEEEYISVDKLSYLC